MPESKHFLGKISVRAIVVNGGNVLLDRDSKAADVWEIPGGRLHEGEGLEECLKREILEELGVRCDVGALVYSEQFHQSRDGSLHLLLAYEVILLDPIAALKLNQTELTEVKWIDKNMIDHQKLYPNCLNALKAYWKL